MTEGRILGRSIGIRIDPETLGKYADCFMDPRNGYWYASIDADRSDPFRPRARRGSLPRPEQDTPALTAQVYAIHQRAARRLMLRHLRPEPRTALERFGRGIHDRIQDLLS